MHTRNYSLPAAARSEELSRPGKRPAANACSQEGPGFTTQKNRSGRYMSEHPDKPMGMFWIEGEDGEIVNQMSR